MIQRSVGIAHEFSNRSTLRRQFIVVSCVCLSLVSTPIVHISGALCWFIHEKRPPETKVSEGLVVSLVVGRTYYLLKIIRSAEILLDLFLAATILSILPSSKGGSILLPFSWLHCSQAVTMLEAVSPPPLDRGMTWSSVPLALHPRLQ
jgi:hypothetical protein